MSDELIEGHALRGRQPEPEPEAPRPSKSSARSRKDAPPHDEPTGPYIILEPPPEAGDVLSRQSEMSTFHKGLQPVFLDESAATPAQPAPPASSSDEDKSLSADLPWSVIESSSQDMLAAGAQAGSEPGTKKPASEPPPDFLPHFHTPTGTFPPVKEELLSAQEAEEPVATTARPEVPPAGSPPDFLPHFHTPTGTFPPIKEDLLPAQEVEEPVSPTTQPEASPAGPPPDFLPHFHTPTGTFPPVKEDLLPAPEAGETVEPAARPETSPAGPPPDFLPHFHTPTGVFPSVKEDLLSGREAEEAASSAAEQPPDYSPLYRTPAGIFPPVRDDQPPAQEIDTAAEPEVSPDEQPPDFSPLYRTPAGVFPPIREDLLPAPESDESTLPEEEPSPEFSPHYRTPAGVFPPVRDDQSLAQETKGYTPSPAARPEELPVAAPPALDIDAPVPVTHFQEGLHPSQEIDDTAPPPIAPVSEEPSEFIPLFHTPTSVLPRVPDEVPVLEQSSADSTGEQTGDEVVDAEWVVDVDRRLHRARRKLQATANRAASGNQRIRSRVLTGLAVAMITVLVVLVTLGISAIAHLATTPPGATGIPGQSTTSIAPGELTTPGVPLLSPTATVPPLYSQGRLAYSSNRDGDFEIYVLDMRNDELTRWTDNPAADRSPKWSPDGRQMVFVSDRSGNDDLYLISGSRSEPVQLTSDSGSDRNPAWSPDGSRIVFSRETVDGSHLMSMPTPCLSQPDTCESEASALTPGGYDLYPAWSPDGRWIAFAASDFPGLPSVIALISPEGDNYNALTGTGTSDFYPAWSPDGNRIAFVSYAQGDYDLWVMGTDGKGPIQLTQSEAIDVEPDWSPDGAYIVFASNRSPEDDFELYLIRSDCTSPKAECEAALIQLTNDSSDDLNPDWIP